MGTVYLKNRDTRPVLERALLNEDDSAHDLTGATGVKLHITLEGSGTVVTRDMVIDTDPTTGIVRYTWQTADWTAALVPGAHRMEYEVLGSSSARGTFPNFDYDVLWILPDLGQG